MKKATLKQTILEMKRHGVRLNINDANKALEYTKIMKKCGACPFTCGGNYDCRVCNYYFVGKFSTCPCIKPIEWRKKNQKSTIVRLDRLITACMKEGLID
jgi:hypothetical protein